MGHKMENMDDGTFSSDDIWAEERIFNLFYTQIKY